ncbi:K(+)/H(+) antiporter subunit KhtU (plasmid) [Bacillus thuringiensis]|nr:K(+)/H(+) antiporter subunit KhtU [Bacillus thuringiensis]
MLVGPHAPVIGVIDFRFIESESVISFLGRIGVLFLLFYLGLEFSMKKLIQSGRAIAIGGTIYILVNFSLGLLYGFLMGFPLLEILIIAGIITISSSAIVAKVLVDLKRTGNNETELILGIIMFEDIFLAVYLSVVSGLVLGDHASFLGALTSISIALGYMLLFFIVARKATPLLWLILV